MSETKTKAITLTIGDQVYTTATPEQLKELGSKIFVAGDGLKDGETITFAPDLQVFVTSRDLTNKGKTTNRSWGSFPCTVIRNGVEQKFMISSSMLTGSAYTVANPINGEQKNIPFNNAFAEALIGITDNVEKFTKLTSMLAGKTFKIRKVDYYTPTDWANKTYRDENNEVKTEYKPDGSPKQVPAVKFMGDIERIPTSRKSVTQLV